MIIWLNGGFGSGKTQTAYELNKRIENSYVFDPEETGFFIRSNIPKETSKSDFQDHDVWRLLNNQMISYINANYSGTIIIPMTVTDENILNELTENLDIKHFTLTVTSDTLTKRLKGRGEKKSSWALKQVSRCVNSLSKESFKEHVHTDDLSIDEVVEEIARRCKINLRPDNRSILKKKIDRLKVWNAHIKLFK